MYSDKIIFNKYLDMCQINGHEHLPILEKYAEECNHVTEMGVAGVISTWALLAGSPKKLVSIDLRHPSFYKGNLDEVITACAKENILFEFRQEDTLIMNIEETDLLFIDTWHTYEQLSKELLRHASMVRKYILFHDTVTFGLKGEDGSEGLLKAIFDFLNQNPDWVLDKRFYFNNGMIVIKKV
jgi:hypothetical protein